MTTKPRTVIVVGAGLAGLSTSFHLAEKGVSRIFLLDKGRVRRGLQQPLCCGQRHVHVDRGRDPSQSD